MGISTRLLQRSILAMLAFSAALCSTSVHAQQGEWKSKTFSNGLKVHYCQDTTRKLLHMGLTMRGGASLDPEGASGLSHLYEHLFFRYLPDSTPADQALEQGFFISHNTQMESHFFGLSVAPEWANSALQMLATGLAAREWNDSTLEVAKAAVAGEMQQMESSPEKMLQDEVLEAIWKDAARLKQPIGKFAELSRLHSEDIIRATEAFRHPANCLLSATGPASSEDFFVQAVLTIGKWRPVSSGAALPTVDMPKLDSNLYFTSINEFVTQPLIMMAWPIPATEKPALTKRDAEFFCQLASLRQGRMYTRLVGGGLAKSMHWSWAGGVNPGQLLLYVFPETDSFAVCMAAIHEEIGRMGEPDGFRKEDVLATKRALKLQNALDYDLSMTRLISDGQAWLLDADSGSVFPEIDVDRMRRFCSDHLATRRHAAGLLLNSKLVASLDPKRNFVVPVATAATGTVAAHSPTVTPKVPTKAMDPATLRNYRVYFDASGSEVDASGTKIMEELAAMLIANPQKRIFISSYSEGLGDGVKNYQLSVTRARQARAMLHEKFGVPLSQVVIRAYGEAFPEFADEGNMKNRRLTFDFAPQDAVDNAF